MIQVAGKPIACMKRQTNVREPLKEDGVGDRVEGLREVNKSCDAGQFGIQGGDNVVQDLQSGCSAPMARPKTRLQVRQDVVGGKEVAELFVNQFFKNLGQAW